MYANGELYQALGISPPEIVTPTLEITDAALAPLQEALSQAPADAVLRLTIDQRFGHDLFFGNKGAFDSVVDVKGIKLHLDPKSAQRAEGLSIDFVQDGLNNSGFKIDNPNAPAPVNQMAVETLQEKLKAGEKMELLDVRSTEERNIATIEGSQPFNEEIRTKLEQLPKETMLVFLCHHGVRSQRVAEQFAALGFSNVHNVKGGIDAWSLSVDSSVPRY